MASKAYVWIQTTFVVLFIAHKCRLVCSKEEIAAQSFGRTWGWVLNDRIFPLKMLFCRILSITRYLLHWMTHRIQHFLKKRCDWYLHDSQFLQIFQSLESVFRKIGKPVARQISKKQEGETNNNQMSEIHVHKDTSIIM